MPTDWFHCLSEREQRMIVQRAEGLVFREIGLSHGLSRTRVDQIIGVAQAKKPLHVERNSPEHFYLTERFHSPRMM